MGDDGWLQQTEARPENSMDIRKGFNQVVRSSISLSTHVSSGY